MASTQTPTGVSLALCRLSKPGGPPDGGPMNKTFRLALVQTTLAAVGIACLIPQLATAAERAPISRDCATPEHRQLDFWIGDWDTFESDTPGGPSIARARVEPVAEGCAIRERYEQNDGLIGESILSYDPVRKHWQQTWVTNRGALMVIVGNFKDGELVLQGDVHLKDGTSVLQRI